MAWAVKESSGRASPRTRRRLSASATSWSWTAVISLLVRAWTPASATTRRVPALPAARAPICASKPGGSGTGTGSCLRAGRGEGHHVRVFELAESGFGVGLGAVAGDHLGYRPVVAAGDQDPLAEQLGLQLAAGRLVHGPGQPQLAGLVAGQGGGQDPVQPSRPGDLGDVGFHGCAAAAGAAAFQAGRQAGQLARAALAMVWSKPRDCLSSGNPRPPVKHR